MLNKLKRVGIEEFDPDPRNAGGACIFRDHHLHGAMADLADWPAAWSRDPSSPAFSDQVLGLGEHLLEQHGWAVAPHFVLATEMREHHSPLHTDWEGATFADPRTFTLWAPQSHFGDSHLMLFQPEFWPPPLCEFFLDETGLYARTLRHGGVFRRFSHCDRLRVLEVRLRKGEVLAFNGAIPHRTHPDTPLGRRAINLRCPSNTGTLADPKVCVNVTSPFGRALLQKTASTPINHIVSEVDARETPKGYFELRHAIRRLERSARCRRLLQRVKKWARLR